MGVLNNRMYFVSGSYEQWTSLSVLATCRHTATVEGIKCTMLFIYILKSIIQNRSLLVKSVVTAVRSVQVPLHMLKLLCHHLCTRQATSWPLSECFVIEFNIAFY